MQKLFRQSSLDNLSSPDQLDSMLKVVSPRAWVGLVIAALLVVALAVWSFLGSLPTTVDLSGYATRDAIIGFTELQKATALHDGLDADVSLEIKGITDHAPARIESIDEPIASSETLDKAISTGRVVNGAMELSDPFAVIVLKATDGFAYDRLWKDTSLDIIPVDIHIVVDECAPIAKVFPALRSDT